MVYTNALALLVFLLREKFKACPSVRNWQGEVKYTCRSIWGMYICVSRLENETFGAARLPEHFETACIQGDICSFFLEACIFEKNKTDQYFLGHCLPEGDIYLGKNMIPSSLHREVEYIERPFRGMNVV